MNIKARAVLRDGRNIELPVILSFEHGAVTIKPQTGGHDDYDYIDLMYDLADAKVGDDGYYVVPRGGDSVDHHICEFVDMPDARTDGTGYQMPMFGFVRNVEGWCAVVTGYTYDYHLITEKKGEDFHMFPRFYIEDGKPYEEISIKLFPLRGKNADYSGVARAYRGYMLRERGCRLIRERANDELRYAAESVYIRIRLAWKPVPSPVDEQTDENEPPMRIAMTFDDVSVFLDKLKAAGVEKAEICLVGWNISGHDGRWPQIFPVEPKLGGEERLKALIAHAKELGYQIVCHTNSTDCYSIADNYDISITRKEKNGRSAEHAWRWSGGLPRYLCPLKGLEFAKTDLPKVAALGFRGLHYIDVISTIGTLKCYDPEHPVTMRGCADAFRETAKIASKLFGGFASEGGYDHTMPYLDYGLYVSFYDTESKEPQPLFTRSVPLWQIVFHGITLSNPYTSTVNAPIKSRRHQLEVFEYGGRPTIYVFSKFVSNGNNWMGNDDLTCSGVEDTDRTVRAIADYYNETAPLAYLQYELIDHHEYHDGVSKTFYENGDVMVTDYENGTYHLEKSGS